MTKDNIPERFFRLAVDNAFNHVIITDLEGTIIYANKGVEKITGFKRKEVLGKTPRLWGKQMDPPFYKKLWKTIKQDKKPFHGEVINKRKNGEQYIAIGTISPILDEKKKLVGFMGIEEDITEKKKYAEMLEKEVAKRTKELEEKIVQLTQLKKEKDDFITSASHQLRTPASVIQMQLDMIKREVEKISGAEGLMEELDVLTENNKRAINIMNDLFRIVELGENYVSLKLKKLNLKELVDQIIKSYNTEIKKKKLKVTASIPKTLSFKGDEGKIKNVLIDLIDNAIAYSNEKGTIEIEAGKKGKKVIISVRDEGIGIPQEDQVNICNKFFRAKNAYLKKTVGTGLGLTIAKTIVEGHKGKMDFTSVENEGSTFTITLPA